MDPRDRAPDGDAAPAPAAPGPTTPAPAPAAPTAPTPVDRLEPAAQVVVALAAQARFAGYARLYAVLAFLGPGLVLLATPLRPTDDKTFWPAGDAIIYGDDGGVLLILALLLFAGVLVAGAFNPVRAGLGSAAAACGVVVAGLTALSTLPEDHLLSAGGWGIMLIGLACAVVGAVHEIHLYRARRRGLGV